MNQEELNRTAIMIAKESVETTKKLAANIRSWAMVIISVFTIAIIGAIYWSGNTNNQVENNTKSIDKLTELINEFVVDQKVINESSANKDMLNSIIINYEILSYWAETKGYIGSTRSDKQNIAD